MMDWMELNGIQGGRRESRFLSISQSSSVIVPAGRLRLWMQDNSSLQHHLYNSMTIFPILEGVLAVWSVGLTS
jgi:hypothetical protein